MQDIEDLLGALEENADGERVSVREVLAATGPRAHGPVLLTVGLIAVSPIGGMPGVPAIAATIVFLISVQMIFSPRALWLPDFLLRRSVESSKLKKAVSVLRRPARFIDKLIRPRLTILTHRPGTIAIGVLCMLLAISVPMIELIPFAGLLPAAAFVTFGLALSAHDGLLAVTGFLLTSAVFFLAASALL